jgi:hypothetical protein
MPYAAMAKQQSPTPPLGLTTAHDIAPITQNATKSHSTPAAGYIIDATPIRIQTPDTGTAAIADIMSSNYAQHAHTY